MRSFIILAGLVVVSCSPSQPTNQAAAAKPLGYFNFRGLVAGRTTVKEASAKGLVEYCDIQVYDKSTNCDLKD